MVAAAWGGATYLLHLCKQCLEIYPSPCCAGEGRVKILSSNLMPAYLFSSAVKLKRGQGKERKGKMLGLEPRAGRWLRVKPQHPQPKALLVRGHGTQTHRNAGNR